MPHSPCRLREEAVFDNTRKVELSRELIDLFSSYFQHFHLVHSFMPHDIKSSCKNQYGCLHMMYFCGFCVFFCIIVCRSQRMRILWLRIRLVCIVNHYNLSSRWQRDMYSHVQTKTIHPGLLLLGKTIFHQAWQGRWKQTLGTFFTELTLSFFREQSLFNDETRTTEWTDFSSCHAWLEIIT